MPEVELPGTNLTETVPQPATEVNPNINIDPPYVNTFPGQLNIANMVFNILGFVCIMVSEVNGQPIAYWFIICAMGGFGITAILLALHFFNVIKRNSIPWTKLEMFYCGLWCFSMLTASAACAAQGSRVEAWAAASFFGLLSVFTYGVDASSKFKALRAKEMAQAGQFEDVPVIVVHTTRQ
ncbi:uncharacterized protein LOC130699229 [Daphnia carinata]|uniref:uncharacterized protein LOC130699229 n=1 Tax=Daphnia carinata TaxID=120202 RepID=UPI00257FB4EB|nr:uncharacterized protein LOC130699229 [Daphnia carinata]XP_057377516.1 uncharacterized protein LOC130699229 [Daphnia carinata]XP_057377517.1 uncharacterized protein LOC130699229 [Daphnia carinata]XP_057377518.1 uncharacterized protein LOC130699229 [Daphnia carinata]